MSQSGDLCTVCQSIDLAEFLFSDVCPQKVTLGPFQEIKKKTYCPLCQLIILALSALPYSYWQPGIYPTEICFLGREDGLARPSIVEVWFDSTSDTSLKGVQGHNTSRGEILFACEDSQVAERKPTNRGRLVQPSVDLSMLKEWLSLCEENHGTRCESQQWDAPSNNQLPRVLIDVARHCLVKSSPNCRYVALSYVWGQVSMLQTFKSNLELLQEDGSLLKLSSAIPSTIRDAMEVVSGLGERYLWADALCIVQDDSDMIEHITHMDGIYSGAVLTIVAVTGSDANAGLPGVSSRPRIVSQTYHTIQGLPLVTKLPELFSLLENSTWDSRAWTLQEGLFSKRLLYFTDHRVYFQCRRNIYREDIIGEYPTRYGSVNPLEQWKLTGRYLWGPKFSVYQALVKIYSGRQLSFDSDILDAFAGIKSAMQQQFGWQFASALPERCFHLTLLWEPMGSRAIPRPRIPYTESRQQNSPYPSWCWSAWVGHFYWNPWRTNNYAGNEVQFSAAVEKFMIRDTTGMRLVETRRETYRGRCETSNSDDGDEFMYPRCRAIEGHLGCPVLHFWAQVLPINNFALSHNKYHPSEDDHPITPYLARNLSNKVWIYDLADHHCGTLTGLGSWPRNHENQSSTQSTSRYELVLLSRFRQEVVTAAHIETNADQLPLEFPSSEEYYDENFDTYHYKPTEYWAANIMLVEWKGDYALRVAIGQMHAEAWQAAGPERKLIVLA